MEAYQETKKKASPGYQRMPNNIMDTGITDKEMHVLAAIFRFYKWDDKRKEGRCSVSINTLELYCTGGGNAISQRIKRLISLRLLECTYKGTLQSGKASVYRLPWAENNGVLLPDTPLPLARLHCKEDEEDAPIPQNIQKAEPKEPVKKKEAPVAPSAPVALAQTVPADTKDDLTTVVEWLLPIAEAYTSSYLRLLRESGLATTGDTFLPSVLKGKLTEYVQATAARWKALRGKNLLASSAKAVRAGTATLFSDALGETVDRACSAFCDEKSKLTNPVGYLYKRLSEGLAPDSDRYLPPAERKAREEQAAADAAPPPPPALYMEPVTPELWEAWGIAKEKYFNGTSETLQQVYAYELAKCQHDPVRGHMAGYARAAKCWEAWKVKHPEAGVLDV